MDHDIDVGRPPLAARKSYAGLLGALAALAIIAGVSGLLWVNYDHLVEVSSQSAATTGSLAGKEETSALTDVQAIQRQTSETLLATRQQIEAQQAEIRRLSEQVTGLTDKIEQMQTRAAPAPPPPRLPRRRRLLWRRPNRRRRSVPRRSQPARFPSAAHRCRLSRRDNPSGVLDGTA